MHEWFTYSEVRYHYQTLTSMIFLLCIENIIFSTAGCVPCRLCNARQVALHSHYPPMIAVPRIHIQTKLLPVDDDSQLV